MKETPIPFSAPMVRAIISGRKTQTRRALKPQPTIVPVKSHSHCLLDGHGFTALSKYGVPGDRLWVKETYAVGNIYDGMKPSDLRPRGMKVAYAASGGVDGLKLRPSMFMCRWMSRLLLENTEIRVQRLLDISEEDAIAEGLSCLTKDGGITYKYGIPDRDGQPGNDDDGWPWSEWDIDPRMAYFKLWDKINGKGAAQLNPWNWAVTFKEVTA